MTKSFHDFNRNYPTEFHHTSLNVCTDMPQDGYQINLLFNPFINDIYEYLYKSHVWFL